MQLLLNFYENSHNGIFKVFFFPKVQNVPYDSNCFYLCLFICNLGFNILDHKKPLLEGGEAEVHCLGSLDFHWPTKMQK